MTRERDHTGRIRGGIGTAHHMNVRKARERADKGETQPVYFAWFDSMDDRMRVTKHAVLWRNDKLGVLMLADPSPQTWSKRHEIKDVDFTPDAALERAIETYDANAEHFQAKADRLRKSAKLARELLIKTREDALAAAKAVAKGSTK